MTTVNLQKTKTWLYVIPATLRHIWKTKELVPGGYRNTRGRVGFGFFLDYIRARPEESGIRKHRVIPELRVIPDFWTIPDSTCNSYVHFYSGRTPNSGTGLGNEIFFVELSLRYQPYFQISVFLLRY